MLRVLPESPPGLVGSVEPRLWTPPRRPLTPETSRGFEAADFAESVLGMRLVPWQRWLFEHALELDESGAFRFRTLLVLIARQSGKTTWMQVLALWRMFVDSAGLVIGTAQNLDVAEEAWTGAVDMAEGVPDLASEIASVDRTNGKKALRLTSGERYKVAAASRRGGRGLSGDLVVLDELREHHSWDAWGAVTKTTMARPRPQIVCLSNAGDSASVVLNDLRGKALAAMGDPGTSLGIFEWSAPDGCALDDRAAWAQANPSLGWEMSPVAIEAALETDPEAVFRTEVLCQWVDVLSDPLLAAFRAAWPGAADPGSELSARPVFGVEVSWERTMASIAVAGVRADGLRHLELVADKDGTDWVVPRLVELASRWTADVALDPGGPAGSLIEGLKAAGVDPLLAPLRGMQHACGSLFDLVAQGGLRHRGQEQLDRAVADSARRTVGDSWVWKRRESSTPLVAATVALWGSLGQQDPEPEVFFV